jgi:mRNA-degrading endonuclease RelE of RelBE toxin-antitoxin system
MGAELRVTLFCPLSSAGNLASVKKLIGYEDRYRLRVGDYRVIYEVIDGQVIILVVGVGHRRETSSTSPRSGNSVAVDV